MPTATPAIKRPTMSITRLIAPACNAHPKHDITAPAKTDHFRPRRSPVKMLMIVPRMAPPWNAETIPPVTLSLGSEKYLMNSRWPIVDVMIPLS